MSATATKKAATKSKVASRGRTSSFSDDDIARAQTLFLAGDSTAEVAAQIGCTSRTVRSWVKKFNWRDQLRQRRKSITNVELEIARLAAKPSTTQTAHQLAMLTKSVERMRKSMPKPKPKPMVRDAVHKTILEKVLHPDYGLYGYQVDFLTSEERFRAILKARQIGFSYIVGLAVLLGALAGRPQVVVSASEHQALIILKYLRHHAERLDIVLDEDKTKSVKVNGVEVLALSTNFRTNQGWPGDVWFDEFAWARNQKMLWGAIVPSITQVGGRVTVFSTPFLPGSLFWQIMTNHNDQYGYFRTWTVTIQDAIKQGMPLPGGLDELRMLFDSETWAMFYECQWAEDGQALLDWKLLHSLTNPSIHLMDTGRRRAGVDVGRTNDRFAIAFIDQLKNKADWVDKYALTHYELHKNMPFRKQRATIDALDKSNSIDSWQIDRTGMGAQLAEELETDYTDGRFQGIWFSIPRKEKLALNMLKLCEDRKLILPNDPDVLAQLHAVKKIMKGEKIRYDAERTKDGHADLFWAAALAADGRARGAHGNGTEVEVW